MKFFPLTRVTLLDGPFSRSVRTDLGYVLSWNPDRLLAPFLRAQPGESLELRMTTQ